MGEGGNGKASRLELENAGEGLVNGGSRQTFATEIREVVKTLGQNSSEPLTRITAIGRWRSSGARYASSEIRQVVISRIMAETR